MKKYSLHKGFIPKSIVLSKVHRDEIGEKRALVLLVIAFLATFPLMKSEKEKKINVEEIKKEEKNIVHNHNNIKKELSLLNVNISKFKSENGNIEVEVTGVDTIANLEIENFKINTITESGNNKYEVNIRRE